MGYNGGMKPLTNRRCPICNERFRWANDIPLKYYCWGDRNVEHEEHWEYVEENEPNEQ